MQYGRESSSALEMYFGKTKRFAQKTLDTTKGYIGKACNIIKLPYALSIGYGVGAGVIGEKLIGPLSSTPIELMALWILYIVAVAMPPYGYKSIKEAV